MPSRASPRPARRSTPRRAAPAATRRACASSPSSKTLSPAAVATRARRRDRGHRGELRTGGSTQARGRLASRHLAPDRRPAAQQGPARGATFDWVHTRRFDATRRSRWRTPRRRRRSPAAGAHPGESERGGRAAGRDGRSGSEELAADARRAPAAGAAGAHDDRAGRWRAGRRAARATSGGCGSCATTSRGVSGLNCPTSLWE